MNQYRFHNSGSRLPALLLGLGALLSLAGEAPAAEPDRLVVYSGRAERLIKPVLDAFQASSGIQIELFSSGTTELVNRLQAEGARTPADVLITNDAGSLERARELKLLQPVNLPDVDRAIPATYRATDNSWIGLSGRLWVVVYNKNLTKPSDVASLLDLADPKWKDRIAIPNAGSEYLQAGVSVMKVVHGDARIKKFLEGLKANAGAQVYGKSSQIVEAVAKGQVALGVVNHYYMYRHLATAPDAPIALLVPDQQDGRMGAILNVAGVGITARTARLDAAKRLVAFLVSEAGQKQFADVNKEYPLRADVAADPALPDRKHLRTAAVPLTRLSELREPAMMLIESAGLR